MHTLLLHGIYDIIIRYPGKKEKNLHNELNLSMFLSQFPRFPQGINKTGKNTLGFSNGHMAALVVYYSGTQFVSGYTQSIQERKYSTLYEHESRHVVPPPPFSYIFPITKTRFSTNLTTTPSKPKQPICALRMCWTHRLYMSIYTIPQTGTSFSTQRRRWMIKFPFLVLNTFLSHYTQLYTLCFSYYYSYYLL